MLNCKGGEHLSDEDKAVITAELRGKWL